MTMPMDDVWGVSGRLKKKLNRHGIVTARELKRMAPAKARSLHGVVLERTVRELRGEPCIELEEQPPSKQQIMVSRSFGKLVTELSNLEQAVATYAARVGEKLRRQGSFANGVYVWVATNPFREQDKQYTTGVSVPLMPAAAYTADIITAAIAGLRSIYREGNLFFRAEGREKHMALMEAVDRMNRALGERTVFYASQGVAGAWRMRREMMSPLYTTRWLELPKIQ